MIGLRYIVFAIASLSLTSCISTSYNAPRNCPAHFTGGDKVLIPYLPDQVSSMDKSQLTKRFNNAGVKVAFGSDVNLALTTADLTGAVNEQFIYRAKQAGYTYLLVVMSGDLVTGESYQHLSKNEVSSMGSTANSATSDMAEVTLQLFSLESQTTVYSMGVETTISAWTSTGKNGGETYINLGSAEGALWIAIKKGSKRMLKRCH